MNAKKLIGLALVALLTLVVLVGVAGMGFRMGAMQSANGTTFPFFGRMRGFDQDWKNQGNGWNVNPQLPNQGNGQMPNQGALPNGHPPVQGWNDNGYGYGNPQGFGRGFDRDFDRGGRGGRDGHSFGGFFFGLIHLALLGALGWFGYKYAVNSGWRIVRVAPTVAATAPAVAPAPSVPAEDEISSEDNPQI